MVRQRKAGALTLPRAPTKIRRPAPEIGFRAGGIGQVWGPVDDRGGTALDDVEQGDLAPERLGQRARDGQHRLREGGSIQGDEQVAEHRTTYRRASGTARTS